MKRAWLFLGVGLLAFAGTARAETPPSAWDRAKQPAIEDEYQLHLTAMRVMSQRFRNETEAIEASYAGQLLRVIAMLQSAGAERSANPLLRFDLAEAFAEAKNHGRAAEIYKAAMRDFPDHPRAKRSRFKLAIECGYIGDHECESRLYRQIIAQQTEPEEIATPTLNLAEADMHAHDLREAIEGYREAWRLCGAFEASTLTAALSQWGLAVALDRAGELREADEAAFLAVSTAQNQVQLLTINGVFFFPDYEVNWYEAISYAALGKREPLPKLRLMRWQQAERFMTEWVRGAKKTKDYWLPIAEARLATYTAERKRAEAAVLKAPASEVDDAATTIIQGWPGQTWTPPRAPVPPPPKIKPPPPIPKTGDVRL